MISVDAGDLPLPPLREDLRLQPLPADRSGQPGWVIQDTVVNRFYRIGWLEFEALSRWGGTARELATRIAGHTALRPTVEQITEFTRFLERHQLLRLPTLALEKLRVDS